jgi:hypothetical protein
MASSEPSFDRSPPVGLPAGLLLWSRASRLASGPRGRWWRRRPAGGRDAEHQRRHLLGHQVEVAVRRVDERGLDVVLRPAGIGQVDHVGGDADALARRHDRLDEPVELHVRARLGVVADVGDPDRAHAPDRDLVDVLPVDVGGAVEVDGETVSPLASRGGPTTWPTCWAASGPTKRTTDAGWNPAPPGCAVSVTFGAVAPGAREAAGRGRSSRRGASSRRVVVARPVVSPARRRVAAGGTHAVAVREGEEPTGQGGHGAGVGLRSVHGVPPTPRVSTAGAQPPVRGGERRSPPTVRGLSPAGGRGQDRHSVWRGSSHRRDDPARAGPQAGGRAYGGSR